MFSPTRRDIIVGTAAATVSALVATTTAAGAHTPDYWSLELPSNPAFATFSAPEVVDARPGTVFWGARPNATDASMVFRGDAAFVSLDSIEWHRVARVEADPTTQTIAVWI